MEVDMSKGEFAIIGNNEIFLRKASGFLRSTELIFTLEGDVDE
jgi:hypothetical protein